MLKFLQKRWFLLSLASLIAGGLAFGINFPASDVEALIAPIKSNVVTALVLFLMSYSLDSGHLKAAFRAPAPVLWASLVNFGVIPLLAWGLTGLQRPVDFEIGLMIAASTPCTMAAASVWTRKAHGNDAVSLLVTVVTNGLCFVVTPWWLGLTTARDVQLDQWMMYEELVMTALVPMLLGQVLRQVPLAEALARKYKTPVGVVAQVCILSLVLTAAAKAGVRLKGTGPKPEVAAVLFVWASCIAVHLGGMAVGFAGARWFGFKPADQAAVAFASSQKTLPIGLLLATGEKMFGNPDLLGPGLGVPFAIFPMLMYHASQLFIDTLVADKLAARTPAEH